MHTVKIKTFLEGRFRDPGDLIDLSPEKAEAYVEAGLVELIDEPGEAATEETKTERPKRAAKPKE